jgi:hypothetical protein
MQEEQQEYWLLFHKDFEGRQYNGQIIGSKPIRAVSFESAYAMVMEMKAAVQVAAPEQPQQPTESEIQ